LKSLKNSHPIKYSRRKDTHPVALHPTVVVGPFSKWGIDFMQCNPTSAGGHGYVIIAVDYFTKWDEAMPTFLNDGRIISLFIFNHIIARFRIPQAIITDHGSHFQNQMIFEMSGKLGFIHKNSSPYYPQYNGQVEVVNKS
jgi:hypothetical protein